MFLYSMTLSQATAINQSVSGSFSEPNVDELVVSKGKLIQLIRPDTVNSASGRLNVVSTQEVFGIVRKLLVFRLLGMQRDFLVVGSDAGRLVILEYDKKKEKFVKIIQETYGKTGCRRIVPGEYLAADPKGRVLLVGAVERQKFVYQMNRDQYNKLIISSPLEAHKPHTLTLDICALDNGLENPQFACIEIDYGEPDA